MGKLNRAVQKLDKRVIGVIFGLLFPLIAIVLMWNWKYDGTLSELFHFIQQSSTNKNSFVIFPIIPNLILFYFSNFRLRLHRFTEGLVVVTVFYTVIIAILILL